MASAQTNRKLFQYLIAEVICLFLFPAWSQPSRDPVATLSRPGFPYGALGRVEGNYPCAPMRKSDMECLPERSTPLWYACSCERSGRTRSCITAPVMAGGAEAEDTNRCKQDLVRGERTLLSRQPDRSLLSRTGYAFSSSIWSALWRWLLDSALIMSALCLGPVDGVAGIIDVSENQTTRLFGFLQTASLLSSSQS